MSSVKVNLRAMTAAFALRAFAEAPQLMAVDREKPRYGRSLKASCRYGPLPGKPVFRDSSQKP
jgi:hypothetical protein